MKDPEDRKTTLARYFHDQYGLTHCPHWPNGSLCIRSAQAIAPLIEEMVTEARDEGIRQAVTWLRADYEYGTGPEWRENGAEWIAQRAAEERLNRGKP